MSWVEVLVGLVIAFGLVGIVLPVLPGGSLLIGAAILGWAWWRHDPAAWVAFTGAAVLLLFGIVGKYAVPGRRLKRAAIPVSTQLAGAVCGVVGFFVVPVVGIFLGLLLGVYAAELRRVGRARAWASTRTTLGAIGLSVLIELLAAVLAVALWVVGLTAT